MADFGPVTSIELRVFDNGSHRAVLTHTQRYTNRETLTDVSMEELEFLGQNGEEWRVKVTDEQNESVNILCMTKVLYDKLEAHKIPFVSWDALDDSPPTIADPLAQIKSDLNNQAHSIISILDRLKEIEPTIYGGWRLEVVAATDTSPMYADLFGLNVIDPDPANEATDTIVCSINMVGADMCQHKQFPKLPDDNQWVIEVLPTNGVKHRFHTHSSGDFGLIFDAIRAGVTTKVYSTRPSGT